MTPEQTLLQEARAKFEHMFKAVILGKAGPFTANGTKYTEIKSGISRENGVDHWLATPEEAVTSWLQNAGDFAYEHGYEAPFQKTLVWRIVPEIDQRTDNGNWAVYSRFAVEGKTE